MASSAVGGVAVESPCPPPAPPSHDRPFASLSPEEQQLIREKQKAAKQAKKRKTEDAKQLQQHLHSESKSHNGTTAKKEDVDAEDDDDLSQYPTTLTQEAYFTACPRHCFHHSQIRSDKRSLDILMALIDKDESIGRDWRGVQVKATEFQFFQFDGTLEEMWDPTFFARLAWEGFFTITGSKREPLPELQPFYGVIDWKNLNASKLVKKTARRIRRELSDVAISGIGNGSEEAAGETPATSSGSVSAKSFHLYANRNPDTTYERLDQYHKKTHGTNWMTPKYFQTMKRASNDPKLNFQLQTIELYDGDLDNPNSGSGRSSPRLIAGEIGFTMGGVYTSMSGFYEEPGAGTSQLVCLGKWLEHEGYNFWSLGHCYSPHMDYKRQLGHRIMPRMAFLKKLRRHRGALIREDGKAGTVVQPCLRGKCDIRACLAGGDPGAGREPVRTFAV